MFDYRAHGSGFQITRAPIRHSRHLARGGSSPPFAMRPTVLATSWHPRAVNLREISRYLTQPPPTLPDQTTCPNGSSTPEGSGPLCSNRSRSPPPVHPRDVRIRLLQRIPLRHQLRKHRRRYSKPALGLRRKEISMERVLTSDHLRFSVARVITLSPLHLVTLSFLHPSPLLHTHIMLIPRPRILRPRPNPTCCSHTAPIYAPTHRSSG